MQPAPAVFEFAARFDFGRGEFAGLRFRSFSKLGSRMIVGQPNAGATGSECKFFRRYYSLIWKDITGNSASLPAAAGCLFRLAV